MITSKKSATLMENRRTFLKKSALTVAALPVLSSCINIGTIKAKVPMKSKKIRKAAVLCFGCINNCDYQAVNMEYNNEKVMGFNEFLEKNNLKFELPVELGKKIKNVLITL